MDTDKRVSCDGYQYVCAWGLATERMYGVTITIAKTATASHFSAQTIPGCGQKVSIFFNNFSGTNDTECPTNQVSLLLRLNRDNLGVGSVPAVLLTLDNQPIKTWDIPYAGDTGSQYQWFNSCPSKLTEGQLGFPLAHGSNRRN
jgi:hypothetical protein